MLTIRTTGSMQGVLNSLKDVTDYRVPYATATALTRLAQNLAKTEIPRAMRLVFINPTPYALNSLFVIPASRDKLTARVMVKNSVSQGIGPEKFLQPEVDGGERNEKRFERALQYGGFLKPGERAMPARDYPLDAYGNVPASDIRKILNALDTQRSGQNGLFAGPVQTKRNGLVRGIWQRSGKGRDGRSIKPLFIFTTRQPKYRALLDFTGIAQKYSELNFSKEFNTAFTALVAKGQP